MKQHAAAATAATLSPCTLSITVEHLFRDEIMGFLDRHSVVIMMEALPPNDGQFHLVDYFCFLHGNRFSATGFSIVEDQGAELWGLSSGVDDDKENNNPHVGCCKAIKGSAEKHQLMSETNVNNNIQQKDNIQNILPNSNKDSSGSYSEEEAQLYTKWMKTNPICNPTNCIDCHMIGHHHKERCEECDQFQKWNTIKCCDICGDGRCCTDCSYDSIIECEFCEQTYCFDCLAQLDIPTKCSCCDRHMDFPYLKYDVIAGLDCGFPDNAAAVGAAPLAAAEPNHEILCW